MTCLSLRLLQLQRHIEGDVLVTEQFNTWLAGKVGSNSSFTSEDYVVLFKSLGSLLLIPRYAVTTAHLFRPLLIEIVSRLVCHPVTEREQLEARLTMFSLLLPRYPQLKPSFKTFLQTSPSPLDYYRQLSQQQLALVLQHPEELLGTLQSIFKLLFSCSELVSSWDLSLTYDLVKADNLTLAGLSLKIIQLHNNLSELEARQLVSPEIYLLSQELLLSDWEIPTKPTEPDTFTDWDISLASTQLSSNVTCIGNLLVYKYSREAPKPPTLIPVPTTLLNIREILLALSMGAPVLLEGATGVGKTAIVEEIARAVCKPGNWIILLVHQPSNSDVIKIHLGDQTDSKALLGAYVATSIPGQFRWQMGVLTKAVKFGHWVLIEDIDLAPQEVISVIVPLLENRTLFIPSRGEQMVASEGFQLFATRRTQVGSRLGSATDKQIPGGSFWTRVHVHPLSPEELSEVVAKRFPTLAILVSQIIQVYLTMEVVYNHPESIQLSALRIGRPLTTRDLIKWCTRITNLGPMALPLSDKDKEAIFSEAVDCFCGMVSDPESIIKVLEVLGDALDISSQRIQYFVTSHAPILANDNDTKLRVGRILLNKTSSSRELQLARSTSSQPFAFTKHGLRLLERVAGCIKLSEPILLVGETGTGKTTVVQNLARLMNQHLIAVNLSQQSDSSDLLGGFKPVDGKALAVPLYETFTDLFKATFSETSNGEFLSKARRFFIRGKWDKLVLIFKTSISEVKKCCPSTEEPTPKQARTISTELKLEWFSFESQVLTFEGQANKIQNKLMFSFIEGSLVKAVKRGYWVLLDEINLATTETLERLSELLQDSEGSLLLTEKGDTEQITRHPNFRVFACMNPATDVGKRDLPPGLRNRFTEFFVQSPDSNTEDLTAIVKGYLTGYVHGDESAIFDVVEFYLDGKSLQNNRSIADGANQTPHYSIRTLARALLYARQILPNYGLRRSLYEGLCMTFATQLTKNGSQLIVSLVVKHILRPIKNIPQLLSQVPTLSEQESQSHVQYGPFWLPKGTEPIDPNAADHYVITPSVSDHLNHLARVVMGGQYPVLIQGPTSSGKTSMVEYLAKCTGHRFIRINNHEHTDLQEYIGTYVSNQGQLVFQEGALVTALRHGHWIVLDELNLAPSDVLEALNRLLDDNRELLIAETQEVVKPHPHFMLFATQNPAGLYGGRKPLSRAFRNRFLELHFDDIPGNELETILNKRCSIAPSYCKKLVQVYHKLQARRQATRVFESKEGFITLRDLFRWAGRQAVGYHQLAAHGYMLLAERVRNSDEKLIVKETLEEVMKVTIDVDSIYHCEDLNEFVCYSQHSNSIAWTKAMQRLFSLVAACLRNNEPVLLVGPTGCGKTTVCQMLATALNQRLSIVNCHQNTETSDLLGSQRPLRNQAGLRLQLKCDLEGLLAEFNLHHSPSLESLVSSFQSLYYQKLEPSPLWSRVESGELSIDSINGLLVRCHQVNNLFEWSDGPLVQSMKEGGLFLLDEISLAEDSVLERLNSVLEPSRLLVLAEKGSKQVEELYASSSFQFLATMNPGGDFGKRELSPALRNRFTEIWVPPVTDTEDWICIIEECLSCLPSNERSLLASWMLSFLDWFQAISTPVASSTQQVISLRDILSWAQFINTTYPKLNDQRLSFVHGGCLVFLDGLGSNSSLASSSINDPLRAEKLRHQGLTILLKLCDSTQFDLRDFYLFRDNSLELDISYIQDHIHNQESTFGLKPFVINKGDHPSQLSGFALDAPTAFDNMRRVLRSLQISKPVMLEGSPGVGKTSLIQALADGANRHLVRINLSEQTDLMDLFGTDLPVEGGRSGEFAWRDAPFLQAMRQGWWVLLDEINLASQSVLEGLNSVLDHRGSVYIPELGRTFDKAPGFLIFAAQNPQQQGGGRKGLPRSFLNRFAQVYIQPLSSNDLRIICTHSHPKLDPGLVSKMLEFNGELHDLTMIRRKFGRQGYPWEFNLRDVFRWMDLMGSSSDPSEFLDVIYLQRMRTLEDRTKVLELYRSVFKSTHAKLDQPPSYHLDKSTISVGRAHLKRNQSSGIVPSFPFHFQLLHSHLPSLEALMTCINQNWPAILVGPQGMGKTSLVRGLAQLTGNTLVEFAMNPGVDTTELLGGFEQVEPARYRQLARIQLELYAQLASQVYFSQPEMQSLILLKQITDLRQRILTLAWDEVTSDTLQRCLNQATSLLASFKNHGLDVDLLEMKLSQVSKAVQDFVTVETSDVGGQFEWIEGSLIDAMVKGHWFLVDNANLCHASVLDRLNPLLEPNGSLMLHERGLDSSGNVRWVHPHPNFRIFLAMDPIHGELSRPMRNRGLELALSPCDWSANPYDLNQVVSQHNLSFNTQQLVSAHNAAVTKRNLSVDSQVTFPSGAPREFTFLCRWVSERIQRGTSFESALDAAIQTVYHQHTGIEDCHLEFPLLFQPPPFQLLGHDMVLYNMLCQAMPLLSTILSSTEDSPSFHAQMESAGLYFIERYTPGDVTLRMKFLSRLEKLSFPYANRHLSYLKLILSSLVELSVPKQLFLAHKSLYYSVFKRYPSEELSPVDTFITSTINDLVVQSRLSLGSMELYQKFKLLRVKYKVSVYLFKLACLFDWTKQRAESKMSGYSMFDLSYLAFKTNSIPEGSNPELIQLLYPFMNSCLLGIFRWVDSVPDEGDLSESNGLELLNHLQAMLGILSSDQLEIARLVSTVSWIYKVLPANPDSDSPQNHAKSILRLIGQDAHRAMKCIWKYLAYPTMKSSYIQDFQLNWIKDFSKLDQFLVDTPSAVYDPYPNRQLLGSASQALATLYLLDPDTAEFQPAIETSTGILKDLYSSMDLEKNPSIISEASVQDGFIECYFSIVDHLSLVSEADWLSSILIQSNPSSFKPQVLYDWLKFNFEHSSRSITDFTSVQNMMWILETSSCDGTMLRGFIVKQLLTWSQRFWNVSFNRLPSLEAQSNSEDDPVKGPSRLFQATQTLATLKWVSFFDTFPLKALGSYSGYAKKLTCCLLTQLEDKPLVIQNGLRLFIGSVLQLIQSFSKHMDPDTLTKLNVISSDLIALLGNLSVKFWLIQSTLKHRFEKDDIVKCLDKLMNFLATICSPLLSDTILRFILPAVSEFKQVILNLNHSSLYSFYGSMWVYMGLAFLNTFVPTYPYDPVIKIQMKTELLSEQANSLTNACTIHHAIQSNYNGGSCNQEIEKMEDSLFKTQTALYKLKRFSVPRPKPSQINELFHELEYLQSNLINPSSLIALVRDLKVNHQPASKEKVLQSNLEAFSRRIQFKYPLYGDILKPIELALQHVRHGLRFCVYGSQPSETVVMLMQHLLTYPYHLDPGNVSLMQVISQHQLLGPVKSLLMDSPTPAKVSTYSKLLDLLGQRLLVDVSHQDHMSPGNRTHFEAIFSEMSQIWTAVEDQRQLEARENESLFKTKVQTMEGDEEDDQTRLDREINRLFPQYEDDFGDAEPSPISLDGSYKEMDSDWIRNVVQLHQSLVQFNFHLQTPVKPISNEQMDHLLVRSYMLGSELLQYLKATPTYLLDTGLTSSRALITYLGYEKFCSTSRSTSSSETLTGVSAYNFYHSPNSGEAQKVIPVINHFKAKATSLLEHWPDHAVLMELMGIVDRMESFSCHSPIMKLLTGLELLLRKAQEWEAYASKQYSLSGPLSEATALVVQWRRLELGSWPTLLDSIQEDYENSAFRWWLNLYNIILNPVSDLVSDRNQVVLDSLDQFMRSSTLGEFLSRLSLLSTFANHLKARSESTSDSKSHSQLVNVITNIFDFYQQFAAVVGEKITSLRKPIEKELKDLVKIASWKDVNVDALRQSAQKSHRGLSRLTKKFKDGLLQPIIITINEIQSQVNERMATDAEKNCEDWVGFESILPDHGISTYSIHHNVELGNLYSKFQRLFNDDIYPINRSTRTSPAILETFLTEMVTQIKGFQAEVVPTEPAERSSYIKTRRMIKKKALNDLWKQFKNMGLRFRSSLLRNQQPGAVFKLPFGFDLDNTWSFSQTQIDPRFGSVYLKNHDITKAQFYYQRVLARLPFLNQCAHQPSPDMSPPEIERFLGYVDHLCGIVQQQRVTLHDVQHPLCTISSVLVTWVQGFKRGRLDLNNSLCDQLSVDKSTIDSSMLCLKQVLRVLSVDLQLCPSEMVSQLHGKILSLIPDLSRYQTSTNNEFGRIVALPEACRSNLILPSKVTNQIVENNRSFLIQLHQILSDLLFSHSTKACLLIPIVATLNQYLSQSKVVALNVSDSFANQQMAAIASKGSRLIEVIQIATQKLVKQSRLLHELPDETDVFGMSSQHLTYNHTHYDKVMKDLDVPTVSNIVSDIQLHLFNLSKVDSLEKDPIDVLMNRFTPFLHQFFLMSRQLLWDYFAFHKSVTKLTYITCNLGISLFQQGFCLPCLDHEESDDGAGQDGQTGTGIGEGEGDKDVGEDIENEDQIAGTQNEEKSNHDQSQNEKDKALEMEDDFEGEMEDRDTGEDESEQASDSDNSEDDNMDDQIGSTNGEDDAIDEKIWGEDHPDENPTEAQGGSETHTQDDDIVAKDEDEANDVNPSDEPKQEPKDDSKKVSQDASQEPEEDPDKPEEPSNQTSEKPQEVPQEVPDGDNLNLPDDLELELDEHDKDSQSGDGMEDQNNDEVVPETDIEPQPSEEQIDSEPEPDSIDPFNITAFDNQADDSTEPEQAEDRVQAPPENSLDDQPGDIQPEATPLENDAPPSRNEPIPSNDNMGVSGTNGDLSFQTDGEPTEQDSFSNVNDIQPNGGSNHNASTTPPAPDSLKDKNPEDSKNSLEQQPNPHRALAEALSKWRQRLDTTDSIKEVDDTIPPETNPDLMQDDENQTFEFIENDTDTHDAETVGAATEEQFKKSLAIPEAEQQGPPAGSLEPVMAESTTELPFYDQNLFDAPRDTSGESLVKPNLDTQTDIKPLNLSDHQLSDMRLELEESLSNWGLSQQSDSFLKCQELWSKYEYLTHDLALNLCEQLRLILEPTLASKLQGDYRTGKRLNMKRIIPYIASEFKKDKIWLRRTKPHQRQYQIMIAVDDSKSMSESHSVQLTFESLALVTRALHQLEVGTTSIVSFGERVQLLHPFDTPFTSDSGAQLLSRFTFAQNKTCMSTLLSTSLSLFDQARSHHSRDDLWQLQLILSDGLCEDHEVLQSYLRKAEEKRIMVIFLIMDTKPAASSLLKLQQVKYVTNPESGREQMLITKYLDSFPFRYYLILNQVDLLPHVLSDALRQYFQLVQG